MQFLLKTEVGVAREQMAAFFFWCTLVGYLKPFAGILTDAFPIFGTRRRHYLLFSSVLSALSWIGMGCWHAVLSLLFNLDPGASDRISVWFFGGLAELEQRLFGD